MSNQKDHKTKWTTLLAVPIAVAAATLIYGKLPRQPRELEQSTKTTPISIKQSVSNIDTNLSDFLLNYDGYMPNTGTWENDEFRDTKREEIESSPVTSKLVNTIMWKESHYNPLAVSRVGARGMMQIMPRTWEEESEKVYGKSLPFNQAFNPVKNIKVGTNYLRTIDDYLSKEYKGYNELSLKSKQILIGAAFNGGMGRLVKKRAINKMPKETRNYVSYLLSEL